MQHQKGIQIFQACHKQRETMRRPIVQTGGQNAIGDDGLSEESVGRGAPLESGAGARAARDHRGNRIVGGRTQTSETIVIGPHGAGIDRRRILAATIAPVGIRFDTRRGRRRINKGLTITYEYMIY